MTNEFSKDVDLVLASTHVDLLASALTVSLTIKMTKKIPYKSFGLSFEDADEVGLRPHIM